MGKVTVRQGIKYKIEILVENPRNFSACELKILTEGIKIDKWKAANKEIKMIDNGETIILDSNNVEIQTEASTLTALLLYTTATFEPPEAYLRWGSSSVFSVNAEEQPARFVDFDQIQVNEADENIIKFNVLSI